ncbi:hypothetical protein [Myroides sp. DW712]|uniref:DUF7507 domain-containing protein n=1 Tax=Myroides sp. DW712 TaxID=3389800 RepID=UPI00397E0A96
MIHKKYNIGRMLSALIGVLFSLLLGIGTAWAEGSKDLFPANARGARSLLYLGERNGAVGSITNQMYPAVFPNTRGTHYVYAEEGEQIALATDVNSINAQRIFLFAPDGREVTLNVIAGAGTISNRTEELAGPRLPGQPEGDGKYLPIYYRVPMGEGGIYKVEMIGSITAPFIPATAVTTTTNAQVWPSTKIMQTIIAWDISVAKQTAGNWNWINGRVFTTALNLFTPYNTMNVYPPLDFYGTFKILTYDGYVYNMESNGHSGTVFPITANNFGLSTEEKPDEPRYSSYFDGNKATMERLYGDPHAPDTRYKVFYKVFYTMPDSAMPEKARYALTGRETWLRVKEKNSSNVIVDFTIKEITLTEGTPGMNGAYIVYDNPMNSTYKIVIKPNENAPSNFQERVLEGTSHVGLNQIYWDGKDGLGTPVSLGSITIKLDLNFHFGEIHIPSFCIGKNLNGTIIELLSTDLQAVRSDKVYWEDIHMSSTSMSPAYNVYKGLPLDASHITIPEGTSSRLNGHIFGRTAGNERTINNNTAYDTWAFAERSSTSIDKSYLVADLEVVSITADKENLSVNEEVTYTIKTKNNGPNDAQGALFTFLIPEGFESVQTQFVDNSCGTESSAITFNSVNHSYVSKLDLPNGCEVVYTIKLKAIAPASGAIKVEATILRPRDIYDPDATNTLGLAPIDAHFECENSGVSIPCNNIKENEEVIFSNAGFTLVKDGIFNDLNHDGQAQVGETIIYTLRLTNVGETPLSDIVLIDPLFGGVISAVPVKSINSDSVLDINEVWVYTLTYVLEQTDLERKGVYNQASATGMTSIRTIETKSKPTIPMLPTDPGYDPTRQEHTYVPLRVNTLLITNPMVRQSVKK